MKRLVVRSGLPGFAGLIVLPLSAAAYQPMHSAPPPVPHYLPPPLPVMPVQPYAYPQRALPIQPYSPYRYGYAMPYRNPVYATPAVPRRQPNDRTDHQLGEQSKATAKPAIKVEQAKPKPVKKKASEPVRKKSASTSESQRAFFAKLLPVVERENARLEQMRADLVGVLARLEAGQAGDADRQALKRLAKRYRVQGKVLIDAEVQQDLLTRVDTIPEALALAQAANESAWGTSRFAREGNNLFGIWTYDQSKGIVPKGRPEGAKYLVRKFDSIDESVRYYLHTLNSHPAYQPLRDVRQAARMQGEQPTALALAGGLVKYSAKGELYVELIRQLISRYQLASLGGSLRKTG